MPWGTTVLTGIKWVPHEEQDMSESLTELFADTRAVQEANGSYTITIPSEIAARYGIEAGDDVLWYDDGESDEPRFLPPSVRDT